MTVLRRLQNPKLRDFGVYGVATGFAAALTLIMTRVLWRALSTEEFGVWSLIDPMLLPAASLMLLGTDHAIVKQLRVDGFPLRVVTGSLLISTLPASAFFLLMAGLASSFVFHLGWTGALLLTLVGEALILLMQTAFRAEGAVFGFAALITSRNLLYLLVVLSVQAYNAPGALSLELVFLSRGVCVIVVSLIAVVQFRPKPTVSLRQYRDALLYGFPLLLTTFIYALSDMTDRWFLAEFAGVVSVGVYALHLKIAAILSQAIVIPFGLWFPPERFNRLTDHDGGRLFFVRTALALAITCSYLAGAAWLSRDFLFSLLAPGAVASAVTLACCLGAVACLALSQALNVGLLLPGHTGKNAVCTSIATLANIAFCAVLVPLLQMNGAALSRLASGMILLCSTAAWSYSILPVPFPFLIITLYLASSAITVLMLDSLGLTRELTTLIFTLVAWTVITAITTGVLLKRAHLKLFG